MDKGVSEEEEASCWSCRLSSLTKSESTNAKSA